MITMPDMIEIILMETNFDDPCGRASRLSRASHNHFNHLAVEEKTR